MASQMVHPHGHGHDQAVEGEDEHHHEKKSVLNMVKAKARKIKDTMTKHGHGHDHDHDHIPDDHDLDEEDDGDDETVEGQKVHGAPTLYESTAVISGPATPVSTPPVPSFSHGISETKETDPSKTFVPGTESKVNLERPKGGLVEDPHAAKDTPSYTPPNYQTKVTDPTGAGNEEIGVTPILSSFDKMNIHDESEPKSQRNVTNSSTGSHDQFSPDDAHKPIITPQHPQILQENIDTVKPETNSTLTEKISSATYSVADKAISAKNVVASKLGYGKKDEISGTRDESSTGAGPGSGNYKPSSAAEYGKKTATYSVADKAISAKNVVASKLGYGKKDEVSGTHDESSTGTGPGSGNYKPSSAAEYGKKTAATVTEKPTPAYEKVAEAGTTAVSKTQGATTTTKPENESTSSGQGRGASVRDYFAEKLRPGEEDRALSGVISDALHKGKHDQPETTRPVGKVTESEEVARKLGTGDERDDEKEQSSNVNQAGEKSVVDKVKGTVGSWLGFGGDQSKDSVQQQSSGNSQGEVADNVQQGKEERRLQESSN
ncbi:hypothetical protein L484_015784 [Morus notabilis]|uniref:Low-temperature-induced 65 kDa protein n=1 Tax=Morus notabilis TaxID=981085 RepID=W9S4V8_9ROSA|nr:low-temperature-induced 65 kDa protein isoform X2 [Morus notabilis]EXC15981.1 hypothetical protein L484_015784 [Morus notabilis]